MQQTDIQLLSRDLPHPSPATQYSLSKVSSCASSWGKGTCRGGGGKALMCFWGRSNCKESEVIQSAPFLHQLAHPWQWRKSEVAQSSRRFQGRHWGGHRETSSHSATMKQEVSEVGEEWNAIQQNNFSLTFFPAKTSPTFSSPSNIALVASRPLFKAESKKAFCGLFKIEASSGGNVTVSFPLSKFRVWSQNKTKVQGMRGNTSQVLPWDGFHY